jgi:hypothetical protein
MKPLQFAVAVVLVVGLTILAGVLHGRMSDRWGPVADTLAAADKLKEIPNEFGDWRLQSSEELGKVSLEQLQPAAYLVNKYQNQKTGDVVEMTLLLGRPGPISVHTPEVCFGTKNYKSRGERQKVAIRGPAGGDDEFWALDFKTISLRGDLLRTYYAWSPGDRWQALKNARFWSAGLPYLYKIQLSCLLPPGATDPQSSDDPCRKFLREFVPEAKKYLIAPAAK